MKTDIVVQSLTEEHHIQIVGSTPENRVEFQNEAKLRYCTELKEISRLTCNQGISSV